MNLKFAAIDIGSNAIRLLISNVVETKKKPAFRKDSFIRVPLRLGDDVFLRHKISDKKVELLIKTMAGFRNLMEVYGVKGYMACATSAMREAANGREVIQKIKKEAGINISIIDGQLEAEILYSNQVEFMEKKTPYLYIDVGGGSTEVSLFSEGKIKASNSFNIGTIRLLKKQITKSEMEYMKHWIEDHVKNYKRLIAIGSGGNINKIYRLSGKEDFKLLSVEKIKDIYHMVKDYSQDERIVMLGLKPDRADVILPAADIFLQVMKAAGINKILVPKLGLVDGILKIVYNNYKTKKTYNRVIGK